MIVFVVIIAVASLNSLNAFFTHQRIAARFHHRAILRLSSKQDVSNAQSTDHIVEKQPFTPQYIQIKDLASAIKIKNKEILKDVVVNHKKKLYTKFDGVWHEYLATREIILPIDFAVEYAARLNKTFTVPVNLNTLQYCDSPEAKLPSKIPVVGILGHFNHGKTTLMDFYCGSDIAENEVHSITQVVRSRMVQLTDSSSMEVTLVDTPGQEIFYRMRNSGADIAEVLLLIVAADKGVCLQTQECIGIIETLSKPVVVCINKIDKPEVTPQRIAEVEYELRNFEALEHVPFVRISAKTGENVDELSELVANLVNGLNEKKFFDDHHFAELQRRMITGSGTIVNAIRSRQHGSELHVLVQGGSVSVGDYFTAGGWGGNVKQIIHDHQNIVKTATPGQGVYLKIALLESSSVKSPLGQKVFFHSCRKPSLLKDIAEDIVTQRHQETMFIASALKPDGDLVRDLERLVAKAKKKDFVEAELVTGEGDADDNNEEENEEPPQKEDYVLIKADTDLSLETILDAHFDAETDSVDVPPKQIVFSGIGDVNVNDIMHADGAKATIVSYGVDIDKNAVQFLRDAISMVTNNFIKPTHKEDFSNMVITPKRRTTSHD